jgi:hypothetical protein
MALGVFNRSIVDDSGNVIPSASLEIRLDSDSSLASIYSNADGSTALTNPFNATSDGFAQFYAAKGRYSIEASNGVSTTTWIVDIDDITATAIGPAGPTGPAGPAGAAGPVGPQGPSGGAALSSCWASNFDIWTRGTSFALSGGVSQYTSDRTISGPGVGGGANVSRQSFALNESVVDRAGSPYYHAMTWTAVPSAGEGRTGYSAYFSDMEMRVEDIRLTAGQQITVSCWLWLGSGSIQMFLYAAQAMGSGGAHNKTGNTISGNSAGVDYDHHTTEVFHRSDAITVTATPTLFSKTFNLDDLSAATGVANLGVLTIGHGMNAALYGPTLNTFGLKYDKGATVLPTTRHEIADLHQYAARHRQVISGIHGIVTSTTAIEISENIHGGFGGNGPTLTMATASPAFLTGGAGVGHSVASGSTFTPSSVNTRQFRGTINGFGGLTVGSPAQSRTNPLIILSQE